LIALLLPAVQAAREAARRSTCTNNLKQLALALHNYHDAYKCFPVGAIDYGGQTTHYGWGAFILPYVEQKPLYDALPVNDSTLNAAANSMAGKDRVRTPIETYVCPSSKSRDTNPNRQLTSNGTFNPGTSNYLGCLGSGAVEPYNSMAMSWRGTTGLFRVNSPKVFADITDGTSNTFALGERDRRCQAGAWAGVNNTEGSSNRGIYMVLGTTYWKINHPNNADAGCRRGYASQHPGGANMALCDGSVRFISELIDSRRIGVGINAGLGAWQTAYDNGDVGVYHLLGMREDGAPVGDY